MRYAFRTRFIPGILLGAMVLAPAWSQNPAAHPPRPGSVNYVEGAASIGTVPVTPNSIGVLELDRGQTLATQAGKVEILLTPGVFFRLADNSSVTMMSPDLANTEVRLDKGRAMVEVVEIRKENNIRIGQAGGETRLLKKGLYDFDADHNEVRVFTGSAKVTAGNRSVTLGSGQKTILTATPVKVLRFERRQYEDEFYRWSGLRSGFLSEASIDVARTYIGPGPGWYGPGWVGWGWYWSPWFGVYTFLPADGVFWGPFGWPFYSPIGVYWSPYVFYGHYPHSFGEFHYPYGHGIPAPGAPFGRSRR